VGDRSIIERPRRGAPCKGAPVPLAAFSHFSLTMPVRAETIHPGGWFPAGLPLPVTETPRRGEPAAVVADESADGLLARAAVHRGRMEWEPALALAREGASRATAARDGDAYARARLEEAHVHLLTGALGRAEEACGLTPQETPPALRASVLTSQAVAAGLGGDAAGALALLAEAGALLPRGEHEGVRAIVLANVAQARIAVGDPGAAVESAGDALRAARRLKDEHTVAVGMTAAGLAETARGSRNAARARLEAAVRGFARTGDRLRQVQCWYLLGELAYDGEDPIRAGVHYRDGLAIARQAGAQQAIDLLTLRFEHR
jgi:hypothetical protein